MCSGVHEVRRVKRNMLVEVLAKELPSGTIRYSSKVVSIEESGFYKLVHLADGTTFKTKVNFISSSKRKRKEKKRKNYQSLLCCLICNKPNYLEPKTKRNSE
jgi:hypothetical protein